MLFFTICIIISQPISPIEKEIQKILLLATYNLQSWIKKKQVQRVVPSKNIYENLSKFLIDTLQKL